MFCSTHCFHNHYPVQFSKELNRNGGTVTFLHRVKLPRLLCSDHTVSGADGVLFIDIFFSLSVKTSFSKWCAVMHVGKNPINIKFKRKIPLVLHQFQNLVQLVL